MIDTKKIRDAMKPNIGASNGVAINIVLEILDSHDELERKLNKAIFIFERFIGDSASVQTNINRNGQAALKQIRGSND